MSKMAPDAAADEDRFYRAFEKRTAALKKSMSPPHLDDAIVPLLTGTLEPCLWYPERLVWPNSWVAHIPFAFWLISALRPRLLVELGVHTGNSYAAFCQAVQRLNLPTRCFGVDTWAGDPHAGFYGEDVYTEITTWHDARHASFSRFIRSTFDEALGKFSPGTIDLLHIDGRHNYEAVRHDFEAWRSRLSSQSIVLLHDINVRERDFGVWQLWEELSGQHPSFEFVHGNGLGVLGVGADLPPTVKLLFEAARNAVQLRQTRDFFARLGNPLMQEVLLDAVRAELESTRAELSSISSLRDAAVADVDAAIAREAEARLREAQARRRAAEAQRREAEAQRHAEVATNDAADAHASQARAEAQLAAVLSSTTWRATMWLRNIVANQPTLRRALRGCAKLAWWTVTLQLPGRLIGRLKRSTRSEFPSSGPKLMDQAQAGSKPVDPSQSGLKPAGQPQTDKDVDPTAPTDAEVPETAPADAEVPEKVRFTERARAELDAFLATSRRLVVPVPETPDISVIVVLWNQAHLTLRCLRALLNQQGPSIEIILIDNASSDETPALLARLKGARVLRRDTNEGFVVGCNRGAKAARGRALLLLNSDAFVRPGALAAALKTLDSAPDVGAVGGRLVLPTGRLQEAGSIIWADGSTVGYGRGLEPSAGEAMFRHEVDYCSGAFLLTPRVLWNRLDGFDEIYSPAYYEEADYCMRLRAAGYRVIYEPTAVVDHYEFGSEAKACEAAEASRRNRKLFRDQHAETLRSVHLPSSEANLLAARECRTPVRRHLLVIDNEVPLGSFGSGYPRARELLAAAVATGWSVTFFPLHRVEIDWDAARREIPWEVEIIAGRGTAGLAGFLQERHGHYDLVMVSRPDNIRLVRETLRHLSHVLDGSRFIYDAEALFANREITKAAVEGRTYPVAEAEALIGAEIALADGADAIVCVTESEADAFRARQSAPVYVLSHSVELIGVTPSFRERAGFLFIGRLLEREAPNWLGLRWFVHECWPAIRAVQPNAVLSVVGHLHPDYADLEAPGVRLLGPAADLRPHYDAARVFVAPIQFGAGIPIKILEATAAGLPTAGTGLMARQLDWRPGVELIAEDGAQELAAATAALHDDAHTWEAMRLAARRRLEKQHTAEAFRNALQDLLGGLTPARSVEQMKQHPMRVARRRQ
jgi:O-antigen biosynthesis protein